MSESENNSILLEYLQLLEPGATFTFNLPLVTSSSGSTYFAKLGKPYQAEQYDGEFQSLKAIGIASPGLSPRALVSGVTVGKPESRPYFISEYRHLGPLTDKAAERLGERLACELHNHKSTNGFGFNVPTYCGSTRQSNGWFETWEQCYNSMIGDLLDWLKRRGSQNADLCEKGEEVRKRVIPYLLRPLVIQPVLLHGDLWSGNTGTDTLSGEPVVYDPSSYYGHNEADLAIARIFGGIPATFFSTYHKHLPKTEPADQYELRVDLYELYHYLNHALIFGGAGYASSAKQKMDRLLKYCP